MSIDPYQEAKIQKKLGFEKINKMLASNDEFERLINFRQQHYFNNEKLLQALSSSEERAFGKLFMYRYALQVLYVMVFKIGVGS